jgi:hypothetical protein
MNLEDFDKLLKQCDPAIDSGRDDSILSDGQSRWKKLSLRRVVVRRRIRLCLAASTLIIVGGGLAFWGRPDLSMTESNFIAASSSTIDTGRPHPLSGSENALGKPTGNAKNHEVRDGGQSTVSQATIPDMPPKDEAEHDTIVDLERPQTPRGPKRTVTPSRSASQSLIDFASFIDQAGETESEDWLRSRDYLRNQSIATQRAAIDLVTRMVDPKQRRRASDLVCQAAGDFHRDVLMHWLAFPSMRSMAWDRLSEGATLGQLTQLIEVATSHQERAALCRSIAMSSESESVWVLLDLTRDRDWRSAVRRSAGQLNSNHIQSLIMLMRERSISRRTAAAFVLASIPGDQVDQVVASMIMGGRFRQPAYLVLLSRDTPQARAFLAAAAASPELTPALLSARLHFANMEKTLHQWMAESNGTNNERSDTSLQFMPNTFRNDRCASLLDARRELG